MKRFFLLFTFIISLTAISFAQDVKDKVKISGLMFGDYFYNINNIDGNQTNMNGFQFRRIYFTTDYTVADDFDARFRLESDQSANSNTAGGKLGVMVKDAYLKWKGVFSGSDLIFGLSPTPAFDISEAAWGYRSLEKTIMDLNGIVSSRDLGVDLRGKITENGSVNYWAKIGNNNSNAPENDKFKRYYLLLQFKPIEGFQATIYGDYAAKASIKDVNDGNGFKSNDAIIAALFLNYQLKNDFALGFEGFTRTMDNNYAATAKTVLANQTSVGLSFWAWASLAEKFRLVARYDNFNNNTDNDNDQTTASLILAGLDYRVAKNVSIIPNVEVLTYKNPKNANASTSSSNLQGRVTFAFTF
jgi:predicted porin